MNCNKKINYVVEKLWMVCKVLGVKGNMAIEFPTIPLKKCKQA